MAMTITLAQLSGLAILSKFLIREGGESKYLEIGRIGEMYWTVLEGGGMVEVRNGMMRVRGPIFNRSRSQLNIFLAPKRRQKPHWE